MEAYSRKDGDDDVYYYPQLLDLISKDSNREWVVMKRGGERSSHGHGDEKKLELSLGPPGGDDDDDCNSTTNNFFSFGYFSNTTNHKFASSSQKGVVNTKESSQTCCSTAKVADLQNGAAEKKKKKAFSPAATAVSNSAQKRTAPSPVVGWPPIRSFRKNLASSSSNTASTCLKSASESPNGVEKPLGNAGQKKGLFVKINMDCIPIGRKVDLNAYDSYEKLSSAVDELFRGLLAAQNYYASAGGAQKKDGGGRAITGLLDGSGDYTLVYEDNEGDRMLVGDVPWNMFVATVKRLRVLKSSELPLLYCGGGKHAKKKPCS